MNILNSFCKNNISISERSNNDEREPSIISSDSFAGSEKKNFRVTLIEKSENENDELKILFEDKFKESSKYGTYMINFIMYYDCIDLYKIPLIFIDEFIYWISSKSSNLKEFNYFDLIDSLYIKKKMKNLQKIMITWKLLPIIIIKSKIINVMTLLFLLKHS